MGRFNEVNDLEHRCLIEGLYVAMCFTKVLKSVRGEIRTCAKEVVAGLVLQSAVGAGG